MPVEIRCAKKAANFNRRVAEQNYFPTEADLVATSATQLAFHERAAAATLQRISARMFLCAPWWRSQISAVKTVPTAGCVVIIASLARYRTKTEQIAELLIQHRPASVTDVNIQTGEDPVAVCEVVLPLIKTLRRETSLGISVCLGTLAPGTLRRNTIRRCKHLHHEI